MPPKTIQEADTGTARTFDPSCRRNGTLMEEIIVIAVQRGATNEVIRWLWNMEDVAKTKYRLTRGTSTRAIGLSGKLDTAYSNNLDGWARSHPELGVEWGVGGEPIAMSCDMNIGEVGIEPVMVIDRF